MSNRLRYAAETLLAARNGRPIGELPQELRPRTTEEAYLVQDFMAKANGAICGWKVGGPISKTPLFAPMPSEGLGENRGVFNRPNQRLRAVEAEIAFLLGADLPPRTPFYTREEVTKAIASCHPAIEILEAGFTEPDAADPLSVIADLQSNGGFVAGTPFVDWRAFDFGEETVTLAINGTVRVRANASNPAGTDLLRLVVWLANEGAYRTGGLRKGEWITTGNWTGKLRADAGSSVIVKFEHAGTVTLLFAQTASRRNDGLQSPPPAKEN